MVERRLDNETRRSHRADTGVASGGGADSRDDIVRVGGAGGMPVPTVILTC